MEENKATEEKFESWAILELMGHRRLGGKVSEATLAGGAFVRIDIPHDDPQQGFVATQFYSPGAVYCLTPVGEAEARAVAKRTKPQPVHRYELTVIDDEDDIDRDP